LFLSTASFFLRYFNYPSVLWSPWAWSIARLSSITCFRSSFFVGGFECYLGNDHFVVVYWFPHPLLMFGIIGCQHKTYKLRWCGRDVKFHWFHCLSLAPFLLLSWIAYSFHFLCIGQPCLAGTRCMFLWSNPRHVNINLIFCSFLGCPCSFYRKTK
jgi:hypothetical protein